VKRGSYEHRLYSLAMRLYELTFQQTRENTEEILRLKSEIAVLKKQSKQPLRGVGSRQRKRVS
jgi:hypothetical protein